jgi:uncharacterized lipoprotein NlpE involved in copper resistance
MKKIFIAALVACIFSLIACNNSDKKNDDHSGHTTGVPKTQEDSLFADVMDGHDVGMAKMGKIRAMQAQVKKVLDSIATLPAKAKQAATPLKAKLDSVAADLSYAEMAMDKWMTEFNMDSAKDNIEQRIKYLADEKLKVGKVKEAILGGLEKADSVLKAKF